MLIKLIRLGIDAEMGTTGSGKQVLNFSGAYDVGFGDNKRTQWVKCAMWGERGEKLEKHFTKGTQIVVYLDDVHVETYADKNSGEPRGVLRGTVRNFDFAGSPNAQQTQQPAQAPQQPQLPHSSTQGVQQSDKFSDFDDKIPF